LKAFLARLSVLLVVVGGGLVALTPSPAAAGSGALPGDFCNLFNNTSQWVRGVDDWCGPRTTPKPGDGWLSSCGAAHVQWVAPHDWHDDLDGFRADPGCITTVLYVTGPVYREQTINLYFNSEPIWYPYRDLTYVLVTNVVCRPPPPPPTPRPPVLPGNLRVTGVGADSISLAWDYVPGLYYRIRRDNVEVNVTESGSYTDFPLSPLTTYAYTVKGCSDDGIQERCISAYVSGRTSAAGDLPGGGGGGGGGGTWSGARNDLNGDGKADLLALYTDYTLNWYPGKGDGAFWSARGLGPAGFKLMAMADLDGDGKAELGSE
jgi:hypothetical protein